MRDAGLCKCRGFTLLVAALILTGCGSGSGSSDALVPPSSSPDTGVAISAAEESQLAPQIVSDSAGGAIVVWMDGRNGPYAIYAQRVNGAGTVQWTMTGIPICNRSNYQWFPKIVSDDAGGAIIVWEDDPNDFSVTDLYAQRVNGAGVIQWTVTGVPITTAAGAQLDAEVVSDGDGGAIIVWQDDRNGARDIYAQRVNGAGAVLWTANGVPVASGAYSQVSPRLIADGAGGAIIVWMDFRSGLWDIYAQRVNGAGAVQWAANGVSISAAAGSQTTARIVPDGAGGAIIAWQDSRSDPGDDIYAQQVNGAGVVQWSTDGVAISAATTDEDMVGLIPSSAGGAIIVWKDNSLRGQWVDNAGTLLWSESKNLGTIGSVDYLQLAPDGLGGVIVVWQDDLPCCSWGYRDIGIFARRVSSAGDVQWDLVVRHPMQEFDQSHPQFIPDGVGGAIIVWQKDYVVYLPGDTYVARPSDIYAHHVSASGMLQW